MKSNDNLYEDMLIRNTSTLNIMEKAEKAQARIKLKRWIFSNLFWIMPVVMLVIVVASMTIWHVYNSFRTNIQNEQKNVER